MNGFESKQNFNEITSKEKALPRHGQSQPDIAGAAGVLMPGSNEPETPRLKAAGRFEAMAENAPFGLLMVAKKMLDAV